ncbi:MAG: hypothetical protein Q7S32_04030, partial [bacterium]|nr:hypothetical protein [bacterium]
MPSTAGLELLIREEQLTDEQWRDLVTARRSLVRPFLDSFTLPELCALRCVMIGGHESEIGSCSRVTGNNRFSLKTQGIFGVISKESIPGSGYQSGPGERACPDGVMKIWGLTRGDYWILVTIDLGGTAGWKGRGQEV